MQNQQLTRRVLFSIPFVGIILKSWFGEQESQATANEVPTKSTMGLLSRMERLESTVKHLVPVGAILAYSGAKAPPGYLMCDGGIYSRRDFPLLASVLQETAFPTEANLERFSVPDLRGQFLRGVDSMGEKGAANIDTNRKLGTNQEASIESHNHYCRTLFMFHGSALPISGVASAYNSLVAGHPYGVIANANFDNHFDADEIKKLGNKPVVGQPDPPKSKGGAGREVPPNDAKGQPLDYRNPPTSFTGKSETRPINIAVAYIIRATEPDLS